MIRRIFRTKEKEVTGDWRKLHNQETHNNYSLRYIINMINPWMMRLTGHVENRDMKHA
jgi:hypothetical protein